MINIQIYAYRDGKWAEQEDFTRPISGSDKLDETLDSAVADFTLQPSKNKLPPFTKVKIVANDGYMSKMRYFIVGTPSGNKARMSG